MDIKLDDVQLMFGDCLERLKELPDGSIDLILTDPPYGTTACKWDTVIDLPSMWKEVWRVLKPNGACVLFGSQPFTSVLICSQMANFKYQWVWDKEFGANFANCNRMPMKFHEDIVVFYRSQCTYNKQMTKREKPLDARNWANSKKHSEVSVQGLKDMQATSKLYDEKNPTSILRFNSVSGECNNTHRVHPSQKTVPLLEYLIKTYTIEGETVLDFTMGSGSTGVACVNTDRKFVGIELDANYFGIASKRVLDAMGDQLFKGVS